MVSIMLRTIACPMYAVQVLLDRCMPPRNNTSFVFESK